MGLLLSTPLTVCLSVLGKYVSPLAFLGVVLTDEPVEGLNTYYQRLVARDQDEAAVIVEAALETQPLLDVAGFFFRSGAAERSCDARVGRGCSTGEVS